MGDQWGTKGRDTRGTYGRKTFGGGGGVDSDGWDGVRRQTRLVEKSKTDTQLWLQGAGRLLRLKGEG